MLAVPRHALRNLIEPDRGPQLVAPTNGDSRRPTVPEAEEHIQRYSRFAPLGKPIPYYRYAGDEAVRLLTVASTSEPAPYDPEEDDEDDEDDFAELD